MFSVWRQLSISSRTRAVIVVITTTTTIIINFSKQSYQSDKPERSDCQYSRDGGWSRVLHYWEAEKIHLVHTVRELSLARILAETWGQIHQPLTGR